MRKLALQFPIRFWKHFKLGCHNTNVLSFCLFDYVVLLTLVTVPVLVINEAWSFVLFVKEHNHYGYIIEFKNKKKYIGLRLNKVGHRSVRNALLSLVRMPYPNTQSVDQFEFCFLSTNCKLSSMLRAIVRRSRLTNPVSLTWLKGKKGND